MKISLATSPGRLMGLDLGSKTIGVALSDPLRISVRPLTTLQRTSLTDDCERLLELARRHEVGGIVVGLPSNMDGSHSQTQQLVAPLVEQLRGSAALVELQDERLSTRTADLQMAAQKLPIRERRRRRNEFAAAVILQWYIQEL